MCVVGCSGYQKQRKRDGEEGIPTEHTTCSGASETGGLDLSVTDWITENRVLSSWLELERLTELLLPFQFFGGKMSH